MQSQAATVEQYLAELPAGRREALQAVREVILDNLPAGYVEGMQYGMIAYFVPHEVYPPGYHCDPKQPLPYAHLASQKNYMSFYGMCIYSDPEQLKWFREAWTKTGKKLDMGRSCVRFKQLDDLPLHVIGKAIARVPVKKLVAHYEALLLQARTSRNRLTSKEESALGKKTAKKRPAAKKKLRRSAQPGSDVAKSVPIQTASANTLAPENT